VQHVASKGHTEIEHTGLKFVGGAARPSSTPEPIRTSVTAQSTQPRRSRCNGECHLLEVSELAYLWKTCA
jgi:hypothetical protein